MEATTSTKNLIIAIDLSEEMTRFLPLAKAIAEILIYTAKQDDYVGKQRHRITPVSNS